MICPECAHAVEHLEADRPLETSARTRCSACGYAFVFEPEIDGTSDAEWLDLVRRTSADGAYYFTENQLYCRYARGRVTVTRFVSRRGGIGLALIAIGLGIWVWALKADWGLTLVLGIAVTLTGVAQVGTGVMTRRDPAPREPLTRWLEKWLTAKPLPNLLRNAELGQAGLEFSPPRTECLVIVERDLLVDLLLKNDAQQSLSALIISENGYPGQLVPEARRLLDERSDLMVIAVHDATQHGVELKSRLRASTILPLSERVITDAGLFAAEVEQLPELASTFTASHFTQVPLDALSYPTLLSGLTGVTRGALSLSAGTEAESEREDDTEPESVGTAG